MKKNKYYDYSKVEYKFQKGDIVRIKDEYANGYRKNFNFIVIGCGVKFPINNQYALKFYNLRELIPIKKKNIWYEMDEHHLELIRRKY